MNYTPIGRVRPIHRGAHDASTAYAALDVVRREDGFASYMAKRDVPAGTPLADGEYWGLLSDGGLKAVADASCPWFEETGGAAVCHPVSGYPLEVKTLIAPKQSGSGEPSPDNIRPISGWTGVKLTRCGKNLLNNTLETQTINGVTITNNGDGTYALNGTATESFTVYVDHDKKVPLSTYGIERGKQYKLVGCPAGGAEWQTYQLYLNVTGNGSNYTDIGNGIVFTPTDEDMNSTYNVGISVMKGVNCNNLVFRPMLTDDLTTTYNDFVQYRGNTYTTDFGQTVYGGTLDWNTGVLTVDRAAESLTSAKLNSVTDAGTSTQMFVIGINNASFDGYATNDAPVSSHYKGVKWYSNPWNVNHSISYYSQNNLRIRDSRFGSISDYGAYIDAQSTAGTPVQVAYKLETPTVIRLSPVQIAALSGTNTLVSDCGDTRAAGRTDMTWVTQGVLDRLAALEAAAVSE